jgi:deoxyribonuclease-4
MQMTARRREAPSPRRFGAQMSIAGGLHQAFRRAAEAGCDCLQVFVKNQRQWHAPQLTEDEIRQWAEARDRTRIGPIVAHDNYLINLASPDDFLWNKSIGALEDELRRCELLGMPYLVMHPGCYTDGGERKGIRRIIRALNVIHRRTGNLSVTTLLETTAGQGTSIGYRFEHLAHIIEGVFRSERMGVCFDTCHVFAAGYDLSSDRAYARTIKELDETVGLNRVYCFHLNDSLKPLGSRVDRHAAIGAGQIGLEPFRRLVSDKRFFGIPMIIETPKGTDDQGRDLDQVNLSTLRHLVNERELK